MAKTDKDALQKQNNADAIKLAISEERQEWLKKKAAEEDAHHKKHPKQKSKVAFSSSSPRKKDWELILADFEKKYGHGLNEKGVMIFSSMEEASVFFRDEATLGRKFFVTEFEDDKRLDFHFYSCGDGKCYQGTYLEIEAQLVEAVKQHPDNKNTAEGLKEFRTLMPTPKPLPSMEMKTHIKDHRKASEEELLKPSPAPAPQSK